jgi:hypothetical protein
VLLREGDEVLVEVERRDMRSRIGRIADDHRERLRDRVDHRTLERVEIIFARFCRHRADHAARHQEAEGVDRIARVRAEHDVARRRDRLCDVGETFLGAERRDHLRVGIELHAETAPVVRRLRFAQAWNPARGRIAVGARLADDLFQLVEHMLRRGKVRIAHAEVDDVGARIARRRLRAVDLLEHIGRQAANAVKLFHGPRGS